MKAIIIDNDQSALDIFCSHTRNIPDFDVVGMFDDSTEAYAFIKVNPVDAVFLECKMSDLGGIDLAKRLKKCFPEILIVFVTAYSNFIREANILGADDYVVKPYTEEIMANTINRLKKYLPNTAQGR